MTGGVERHPLAVETRLDPRVRMPLLDLEVAGQVVALSSLEAPDQSRGNLLRAQQQSQRRCVILAMPRLAMLEEFHDGVEVAMLARRNSQRVRELARVSKKPHDAIRAPAGRVRGLELHLLIQKVAKL